MSDDVPSGTKGRRRSGRTAAEIVAVLEADPEWVAARDAQERQLELDEALSREQQVPLLADLSAAGVHFTDVWDLVKPLSRTPLPSQPLVEHLHRDYEEGILEGIARALAVTDAATFWDHVMQLFRAADPDHGRLHQGLAVALSGMATRLLLPQVRVALRDQTLCPGRIFFLGTLTRLRAPDRWDP